MIRTRLEGSKKVAVAGGVLAKAGARRDSARHK
jgi:hypothetical protein